MIATLRPHMALLALCLATAWPVADAADTEPDAAAAAPAAVEPGIVIHYAHTLPRDDVYYLDAQIEYRIGRTLAEALLKGVSVPLLVSIEVVRERPYLWNETTASLEQRYALEYHALTRQYIVRNENIGTQSSYPSLEEALDALGRVEGLPVIDGNLLVAEDQYIGRVQARIDINALPVPLRLLAIVSSEWRLSSDWYEWRF